MAVRCPVLIESVVVLQIQRIHAKRHPTTDDSKHNTPFKPQQRRTNQLYGCVLHVPITMRGLV